MSPRYVTVYTVPNNFTCKPEYSPNECYMINLNVLEQLNKIRNCDLSVMSETALKQLRNGKCERWGVRSAAVPGSKSKVLQKRRQNLTEQENQFYAFDKF